MRQVQQGHAAVRALPGGKQVLLHKVLAGDEVRLPEHEAKALLAAAGTPVPAGRAVSNADAAAETALELGKVVLKPLGMKRRGKAGLILTANAPGEARTAASFLLGISPTVLVEKHIDIAGELYLAVTVDSREKKPVMLASATGGIDVEEKTALPGRMARLPVSITRGLSAEAAVNFANQIGLENAAADDFARAALEAWKVFKDTDADLLEINPLAMERNGNLVAVDALLTISDDALPRQPELAALGKGDKGSELEQAAKAAGWAYIELEGDIGILSSGAGLTMAILDQIEAAGGKAANFLDTTQMDGDGIYRAFELLERNPRAKVILVNIFAGLNRCDILADGIVRYVSERKPGRPIIVRMIGNRDTEGRATLQAAGIEAVADMETAVGRAIALARPIA